MVIEPWKSISLRFPFLFQTTASRSKPRTSKKFSIVSIKPIKSKEGSGLGLAIAKTLCNQNGWIIRCSNQNFRTTFTIYFNPKTTDKLHLA